MRHVALGDRDRGQSRVCFKAPRTHSPGPQCAGDPARVHSLAVVYAVYGLRSVDWTVYSLWSVGGTQSIQSMAQSGGAVHSLRFAGGFWPPPLEHLDMRCKRWRNRRCERRHGRRRERWRDRRCGRWQHRKNWRWRQNCLHRVHARKKVCTCQPCAGASATCDGSSK